jgi:hypothetical protein
MQRCMAHAQRARKRTRTPGPKSSIHGEKLGDVELQAQVDCMRSCRSLLNLDGIIDEDTLQHKYRASPNAHEFVVQRNRVNVVWTTGRRRSRASRARRTGRVWAGSALLDHTKRLVSGLHPCLGVLRPSHRSAPARVVPMLVAQKSD